MPQQAFDEVWKDGVRISRTPREVPDADIERDDAPNRLRQAQALLRQWSNDALDAQALGALTAQQRIVRQAVIEQRVAALSAMVLALARMTAE